MFHAIFPADVAESDRYDTLEEASHSLAYSAAAIYGALLAKRDTGCPGHRFYDTFKIPDRIPGKTLTPTKLDCCLIGRMPTVEMSISLLKAMLMRNFTIFDDGDSEQNIFDELKDDGLVGISGGRLAVRAKLRKVCALIEDEKLDCYWAQSSLNLPETELGYCYDDTRYAMDEAQALIRKSYYAL